MSGALASLTDALKEVDALQRANPSPKSTSPFKRPDITRAIGRSQIVLLSSHFEGYIYAVNEEAIEYLGVRAAPLDRLPPGFRLLHARTPVDKLAMISWDKREAALRSFAKTEATLWRENATASALDAARLLEWMKAPSSSNILRYYKQWGITNIFEAITRTRTRRNDFWLQIDGLVTKRNNIAHGDAAVEATYLDIARHLTAVRDFTDRADRALARQLQKITGEKPW